MKNTYVYGYERELQEKRVTYTHLRSTEEHKIVQLKNTKPKKPHRKVKTRSTFDLALDKLTAYKSQ